MLGLVLIVIIEWHDTSGTLNLFISLNLFLSILAENVCNDHVLSVDLIQLSIPSDQSQDWQWKYLHSANVNWVSLQQPLLSASSLSVIICSYLSSIELIAK